MLKTIFTCVSFFTLTMSSLIMACPGSGFVEFQNHQQQTIGMIDTYSAQIIAKEGYKIKQVIFTFAKTAEEELTNENTLVCFTYQEDKMDEMTCHRYFVNHNNQHFLFPEAFTKVDDTGELLVLVTKLGINSDLEESEIYKLETIEGYKSDVVFYFHLKNVNINAYQPMAFELPTPDNIGCSNVVSPTNITSL